MSISVYELLKSAKIPELAGLMERLPEGTKIEENRDIEGVKRSWLESSICNLAATTVNNLGPGYTPGRVDSEYSPEEAHRYMASASRGNREAVAYALNEVIQAIQEEKDLGYNEAGVQAKGILSSLKTVIAEKLGRTL